MSSSPREIELRFQSLLSSIIYGETPLMIACRLRCTEIVRLLLEKSAKVGIQMTIHRESALIIAIYSSAPIELIEALLTSCTKDDVNLKTDSGNTALMLAIQRGFQVSVIEMLLKKGADINLVNKEGETALMIALLNRSSKDVEYVFKLVKLLLDHDAQINYKKRSYCHDLFQRDWIEVSKLLIERSVNVGEMVSDDSETSLLLFTKFGITDVVKLCLQKWPAEINTPDQSGKYPLWYAVQRKYFEIFELLLKNNAKNAEVRPNNEKSALEMLNDSDMFMGFFCNAVKKINCKLAEYLLKNVNNAELYADNALKSMENVSITPLLEMINSEPETEYPLLKQVLLAHQETMKKVEMEEKQNVPDGNQSGTTLNLQAEPLSADFDADPDLRKRGRDTETTSDIDLHAKKPRSDEDESNDGAHPSGSNLSEISKRERSMSSSTEDDRPAKKYRKEEFLDEIDKAIASGETIKRKHAHSVFIGPNGSGKSSLMLRLLGKQLPSQPSSTGVAKPVVVVDIDIDNPSTVYSVKVLGPNTWQEEAPEKSQVEQILQSFQTQEKATVEQNVITTSSAATTAIPVAEQHTVLPDRDQPVAVATQPSLHPLTNLSDDPVVRQVLTSALEKHGGGKKFMRSFSLYLRDAGGQVEFQEMVSLLVFGPSIFFFVFRADLDLKDNFKVEYRKSASESLNFYTSSITIEEALLQSLASVYAMGMSPGKTYRPYVFIVATHKDKLGASADKKLDQLNKQLLSLIQENGFDDVILCADREKRRIMFSVDNTAESDEDVMLIKSKVHDLVTGRDEFTINYPISYLVFSLQLQDDKRSILSLDECNKWAAKYGIEGSDQVTALLDFLRRIGVLLYYDVDGLRHIIMRDSQVLFDMATNLIVRTFCHKVATLKEANDFEKKGILTASAFNEVVGSTGAISLEDLKKILIHLRIIAPFSLPGEPQECYFIPCVLNHVPEPNEDEQEETDIILAVSFKCKHCPKGIFGVLVTHLMAPDENEKPADLTLALLQEKIYKDQVSFKITSHGRHNELLLRLHSTHIEIKFFQMSESSSKPPIGEVCNHLRQLIYSCILRSVENLHYTLANVEPVECLPCDNCSCLHPVEEGENCHTILCKGTHYIPCK